MLVEHYTVCTIHIKKTYYHKFIPSLHENTLTSFRKDKWWSKVEKVMVFEGVAFTNTAMQNG